MLGHGEILGTWQIALCGKPSEKELRDLWLCRACKCGSYQSPGSLRAAFLSQLLESESPLLKNALTNAQPNTGEWSSLVRFCAFMACKNCNIWGSGEDNGCGSEPVLGCNVSVGAFCIGGNGWGQGLESGVEIVAVRFFAVFMVALTQLEGDRSSLKGTGISALSRLSASVSSCARLFCALQENVSPGFRAPSPPRQSPSDSAGARTRRGDENYTQLPNTIANGGPTPVNTGRGYFTPR